MRALRAPGRQFGRLFGCSAGNYRFRTDRQRSAESTGCGYADSVKAVLRLASAFFVSDQASVDATNVLDRFHRATYVLISRICCGTNMHRRWSSLAEKCLEALRLLKPIAISLDRAIP
jgi:hypothetical protein